jgi:hypothetical protein
MSRKPSPTAGIEDAAIISAIGEGSYTVAITDRLGVGLKHRRQIYGRLVKLEAQGRVRRTGRRCSNSLYWKAIEQP